MKTMLLLLALMGANPVVNIQDHKAPAPEQTVELARQQLAPAVESSRKGLEAAIKKVCAKTPGEELCKNQKVVAERLYVAAAQQPGRVAFATYSFGGHESAILFLFDPRDSTWVLAPEIFRAD